MITLVPSVGLVALAAVSLVTVLEVCFNFLFVLAVAPTASSVLVLAEVAAMITFFVFFIFLFFFCIEPSSSPDAPPLAAASAIFLGLAGEPLPPEVAEELAAAPTERERSPSDVFGWGG